jgi:hypothetical protein
MALVVSRLPLEGFCWNEIPGTLHARATNSFKLGCSRSIIKDNLFGELSTFMSISPRPLEEYYSNFTHHTFQECVKKM